MVFQGSLAFEKSSVCSLISITVEISVNRITEKKNVVRNFLNMYQSIFFSANGLRDQKYLFYIFIEVKIYLPIL